MAVYYGIIMALSIASFLTQYAKHNYKNLYFILFSFLLLTYFSVNRFKIGYDFGPYATMYQKYGILYFEQFYAGTHEKGYALLNHFLAFFSMDYKLLFSVTSVFCIGGVLLYLYKKSNILWMSVYLFVVLGFYYMSYNFIRQFMAAVIILVAFRYIKEKNFLKYLLFVFLAGSFHLSAFIMIPFYFLLQIPLRNRVLIFYLFVTSILFNFSESLIGVVTQYIYKSYDPLTSAEMTKGIPLMYVVPFIVTFVFAFLVRKELIEQDEDNTLYLNALFFILVFEAIALKHGLISRFILLFMIPAMCVLIPNVILVYQKKFFLRKKQVGFALLAILFVYTIVNHQYLMNDNYNGVVPYQTYASMEGGIGSE